MESPSLTSPVKVRAEPAALNSPAEAFSPVVFSGRVSFTVTLTAWSPGMSKVMVTMEIPSQLAGSIERVAPIISPPPPNSGLSAVTETSSSVKGVLKQESLNIAMRAPDPPPASL